jgi:hypothetical protein
LIESIHDTLAGVGDAGVDWTVAEVEEDEEDPSEEVDAYLDCKEIPGIFLGEEEQVASPRVVEEECKGVMLFRILWDDFGEDPYY